MDLPQKQLLLLIALVETVLHRIELLDGKVTKMTKSLDDVLAAVTPLAGQIDSLVTLINGLKQQVADALSGVTLPPAVQAKVDAVFDAVSGDAAKVQAALDANVPPTP